MLFPVINLFAGDDPRDSQIAGQLPADFDTVHFLF